MHCYELNHLTPTDWQGAMDGQLAVAGGEAMALFWRGYEAGTGGRTETDPGFHEFGEMPTHHPTSGG